MISPGGISHQGPAFLFRSVRIVFGIFTITLFAPFKHRQNHHNQGTQLKFKLIHLFNIRRKPATTAGKWLTFLFVIMLAVSCDETYTPKPKGYFRIDLPERKYVTYQPQGCPYEFELPAYATPVAYHDSLKEPCWKYLRFLKLNGEIFLSYNPVKGDVSSLAEGARTLAYKHTVKANAIDETIVEVPGKLYGVIYDIGGNAASSIQFYATDSTRHFLRGALYFNVPPQPDSLAPVIKFLRKDIEHLITTIKWK